MECGYHLSVWAEVWNELVLLGIYYSVLAHLLEEAIMVPVKCNNKLARNALAKLISSSLFEKIKDVLFGLTKLRTFSFVF